MKKTLAILAVSSSVVGLAVRCAYGDWQLDDIGQALAPGAFSSGQSGFTLQSSGIGIGVGGTEDNFTFVHQPFVGDGDFVASLTVVQGPGDQAVGGLMVRDGLGTNAAFFMVGLTAEGKFVLDSRDQAGEVSQSLLYSVVPLEQLMGLEPPPFQTNQAILWSSITPGATWLGTNCWLKVARRGDQFTAYGSADGQTWYWLGSENIPMAQPSAGMVAAGMTYLAGTSAQFAQVSLTSSNAPPTQTPVVPVVGTGDGLLGTYRSTASGNQIQRVDPVINFQWGLTAPDTNIGVDLYQVRWEGMLQAQYSETYTISVVSEDGVRLWLDDRLLIDEWHEQHPPLTTIVPISLAAGQKYTLRLDYYKDWGYGTAQLYWSSPSTPRQIIPQSQLYSCLGMPLLADSNGSGIPDRWERTYGLNFNSLVNPTAATDASGIPYLKDYLAAMDPTQPNVSKTLTGVWQSRDIGAVGVSGTASMFGSQFVVGGSGSSIFNTKDSFQYVYQPWNGDVQIIAHINLLSYSHDYGAQDEAGLMVREDLTSESKNAFVAKFPWNGLTIQHRTDFSGLTTFRAWYDQLYNWVKLVRRGDSFEMYSSVDGVGWHWLNTETVKMATNVYVGLAVSSHDNTRFSTAQFDHVQISQPDPPDNPYAASALGDGLQATYTDLGTDQTIQRVDPNINFDWGLDPPAPGIDPHNFSVQWEGLLEAPYDETFDFRVGSDSPVRLWIDGQLVMDWTSIPENYPGNHDFYGQWLKTVLSYKITLKAGHQYAFKLECLSQPGGRSIAKLYWSSPSTPAQPIPQNLFYSPTNQYYNDLPSTVGDGIPDAWKVAYGLDPNDPNLAGEDPGQKGLTILQDYMAGANPWKVDSNGDGIPDWWAVKYGLSVDGESIAADDPAGDGLSNLQKYQLGLDPTKPCFNGNSLATFDLVAQTGTDPLNGSPLTVQTVTQVPGSAVVNQLGVWGQDNNAIYALCRRGYVEYDLQVPSAGMYRLDVWGGAHVAGAIDLQYPLILFVDGEYLNREILSTNSFVSTLTPWLQAGVHRVRVYWDNASRFYTPLEIDSVNLVSLTGQDKDGNGISDWVDYRLRMLSGLTAGASPTIDSFVSPFCLEGRERYLSTMTLQTGYGNKLTIKPGANPNWYADVPLTPNDPTTVQASFENGGLSQTATIDWMPLDISGTNQITIRKGDSLLLKTGGSQGWSEQAAFVVPGVTNYTGLQPAVIQFDQPGTFMVTGTPVNANSAARRTLQVTVVDLVSNNVDPSAWTTTSLPLGITAADWAAMASINTTPAWVGYGRDWNGPQIPGGAILQAGTDLSLQPTNGLPQAGVPFQIQMDDAVTNYVVARLGQNGPILGSSSISGFRLFSGYDTEVYVVQEYPDGTRLVEMGIVMSPVQSNVIVNLRIIVGGVMFDDGTVEKNLTAKDFDELGATTVRFILPPQAVTSVCHRITAYEGTIPLGSH